MTFITTTALDQEITDTSKLFMNKFALTVVGIVTFSVLSSWNSDCVRFQPWLVIGGLTSMTIGIITGIATCLALGIPYVPNNVVAIALLAGMHMTSKHIEMYHFEAKLPHDFNFCV